MNDLIKALFFLTFFLALFGCDEEAVDPETPENEAMYFPPITSATWETIDPESLGWDASKQETLFNYLEENGTRAFIVLKNGKIVLEEYWGNDILDEGSFTKNSYWYWASAGKTLTAMLTGIAQEQGLLDINDKTSAYLGEGWTSLSVEQENQILLKHQLTMTTGLDFDVDDVDCTDPSCLTYRNEPGTQWYYHNAPYTLLEDVVSQAAGTTYNGFTNKNIEAIVGMNGFWRESGYNNVYWSVPRDAARFGLLMLNEGTWDGNAVLADTEYFEAMINTSQSLNPAYGYLTWLNGKPSLRMPGTTAMWQVPLSVHAPADAYAAMGKNGQFIDVIPSLDMVVVRMGHAPDNSLVPVIFHDNMWELINQMM